MISHTLHPAHIQLSKECDYLIFCFADFAVELTAARKDISTALYS